MKLVRVGSGVKLWRSARVAAKEVLVRTPVLQLLCCNPSSPRRFSGRPFKLDPPAAARAIDGRFGLLDTGFAL